MQAPKEGFAPEADNNKENLEKPTSTRENLTEELFKPGDTGTAARLPEAQDRAAFRQLCGQELEVTRKGLTDAGEAMRQFNTEASQGKIKPGTAEFKTSLDKADNAYGAVIAQAQKNRFDSVNGQIRQSDMFVNAIREGQMLTRDIQELDAIAKLNRAFTPAEAQKYGVDAAKVGPAQLLEARVQDFMVVEDYVLALDRVYGNFGLAKIRSSAFLPGDDKAKRMTDGFMLALSDNSGDPNLRGKLAYVAALANGEALPPGTPGAVEGPKPPQASVEGPKPPQGAVEGPKPPQAAVEGPKPPQAAVEGPKPPQGAVEAPRPSAPPTMITENGKQYFAEGGYKLPSGAVDSRAAGFVDPASLIKQAEASAKRPITVEDVAKFDVAIKAADDIDRSKLGTLIQAQRNDLRASINDAQKGPVIKEMVQKEQQIKAEMGQISRDMSAAIPGIVQAGQGKTFDLTIGNPPVKQTMRTHELINKLGQMNSSGEALAATPENQAALTAFAALPKGAEFLNSLKAYSTGTRMLNEIDTALNTTDKLFNNTRKDLEKNIGLLHAPEDTRASLIRSLLRDPESAKNPALMKKTFESIKDLVTLDNSLLGDEQYMRVAVSMMKNEELIKNPEYLKEAQGLAKHLAAIDPSLLTVPDFTKITTALGLKAEDFPKKPAVEAPKLEQPNPAAPPVQLSPERGAATAIPRAYQVLSTMKPNEVLTQQQKTAFENAIADAKGLNLDAERASLDAQLLQAGVSKELKDQYYATSEAVKANFAKMSQEAKDSVGAILQAEEAIQQGDPQGPAKMQALEGILATAADEKLRPNLPEAVKQLDITPAQQAAIVQALSDPNLKGFTDARLAQANFYKQNPEKFVSILRHQQASDELPHTAAIVSGLYGAALLATGDRAGATPHLQEAAKDPYVNGVREIAASLRILAAPATDAASQAAARAAAAEKAGPVEKAHASLLLAEQAMAEVKRSGVSLDKQMVKLGAPGQETEVSIESIYKKALENASAVTPEQIDQMRVDAKKELMTDTSIQQKDGSVLVLKAWGDPDAADNVKEQQFKKVNADLVTAQQGLTDGAKQQLNTIAQVLQANPLDPAGAAALEKLKGDDPKVKTFIEAKAALLKFYQANPEAEKRDFYDNRIKVAEDMSHAPAIAKILYANALSQTNCGEKNHTVDVVDEKSQVKKTETLSDAELGSRMMSEAIDADKKIWNAFRPVALMARQAVVPGFNDLQEAMMTMKGGVDGKTGTMEERLANSESNFKNAISKGDKVSIKRLDATLSELGKELDSLKADVSVLEQKGDNPVGLKQKQDEFTLKNAEANFLLDIRRAPMRAHLFYAMALNKTAADLYEKAKADPAQKDELTARGNKLNAQAVETLKDFEKLDPKGYRDPETMVRGAMEQASKNQLISEPTAKALGYLGDGIVAIETGINGPHRLVKPIWISLNTVGDGLVNVGEQASVVPIIGAPINWVADAIGKGVAPSSHMMDDAAMAIAQSKAYDADTTNAFIGGKRNQLLNTGFTIASDLAVGPAGFAIGTKLAQRSSDPRVKALGYTAGLLSSVVMREGLNEGGARWLGTDRLSHTELALHAGASYGMTAGLKGLSTMRGRLASGALPTTTTTMVEGAELTLGLKGGTQIKLGAPMAEALGALSPAGQKAAMEGFRANMTLAEQHAVIAKAATEGMPGLFSFKRGLIGAGAGGTGGFGLGYATHTGRINPETGKDYTHQESMKFATQYALIMGGLGATGGGLNWGRIGALAPAKTAIPGALGGGAIGYTRASGINPDTGKEYTQEEKLINAAKWGAGGLALGSTLGNANFYKGFQGAFINVEKNGALALTGDMALATKASDIAARRFYNGLAWRSLEGGTAMSFLAAGEKNPLVQKRDQDGKQTGEYYSFAEMGDHVKTQAAWGAGSAVVAGPLVPKILDWTVVKPLQIPLQMAKWTFNKNAGLAAAETAVAAEAVAPVASRFWSTSVAGIGGRGTVGFVGGAGVGALQVNPWTVKEQSDSTVGKLREENADLTGLKSDEGKTVKVGDAEWVIKSIKDDGTYNLVKYYNRNEMLAHSAKVGAGGATVMIGAPYVGRAGVALWEKGLQPYVVNPVKDYAIDGTRRFLGRTASGEVGPVARVAVGGTAGFAYGAGTHNIYRTNPETGQKYTTNEMLTYGGLYGGGGALGMGFLPIGVRATNAAWAKTGVPLAAIGATASQSELGRQAGQFGVATSDGWGRSAADLYGQYKWGQLDRKADGIIAKSKADAEKAGQAPKPEAPRPPVAAAPVEAAKPPVAAPVEAAKPPVAAAPPEAPKTAAATQPAAAETGTVEDLLK